MPNPNDVAAWLRLPDSERARLLAGPDSHAWIESLARYGFVEAQTLFGQILLERRPAPARGSAFGWFAAAGRAGHPPAINMMGRCLEHGWDVDRNTRAAADCYRRAASAGEGWAQFNLACALLYGIGLPRDRPAAFDWFTHAAESGIGKALNMLARFHEEGWDRPPSRTGAAALYRSGAEAGDFRAQFNLASLLHRQGRTEEALPWLREALRTGTPDFLEETKQLLEANDDPRLRALAA